MNRESTIERRALRIGLIGLGRWGRRYVESLLKMPDVELGGIAGRAHQIDCLEDSLKELFNDDWRVICEDPSLDGVIVATSPESHYEIVKFTLERGLPTLVEKPFTLSASQTDELYFLSQKLNILCMVNYIHLYSRGYKDLKQNVSFSGRVREIYSESFAYGPFRSGVPVLWDWGCHDISMCIDLLGKTPEGILKQVSLTSQAQPNAEILTAELRFSEDVVAKLTFGNLAEVKRRDLCVVCDGGIFVYDGLSRGLSKNYTRALISDDPLRFKQQPAPLECAIIEFINCIRRGDRMHFTLDLARRVNEVLSGLE
jgi:predicted dehydrogenase